MTLIMHSWSPASIPAMTALCGSIVGALGSSIGTWIAQRQRAQREVVAKKVFHREQLYSDFISETARAYADAVQHTFQDPGRLIPSYALLSRMRLTSSPNVVEKAEGIMQIILDTYSKPNLSPEEIHTLASGRTDPLREFSSICRRELESLWNYL